MDGEASGRPREAGSFCVALGSVACESLGRSGGEDAPLSLWMSVQLVGALETPLERVWFAPDEENTKTTSVAVAPRSGKASVAVPVDYEQSSRPVALTQESLQELMTASLVVGLYFGEARAPDKDELVGVAAVLMDDVLLAGHMSQNVEIRGAGKEVFSLSLSVHSDANLADFLVGARLLRIHTPVLGNLPLEWTLQGCTSDEDAVQACASPERNTAVYDFSVTLPKCPTTSAEDTITTILFKGGKLQFERQPEDDSALLQMSKHDEVNAGNPVMAGLWAIRFPEASTESLLYLKDNARLLVDFLVVEKRVQCALTRINLETSITKAAETVRSEFEIALNELMTPGTTQISPRGLLRALAPIERSVLEQELNASASNDDKKKLQGLLSEFDTMIVGRASSTSSSLLHLKTYAGITIEIANMPLVLQPPQELEVPAQSVEEMVTCRDVDGEYEEQRNSIKDLRHEIRGVVVKLLREYEDTFRGPEEAEVTRHDKRQALIFRLNTQGVYHSFKDTLKKRIVSVIRDRFSALTVEEDGDIQQASPPSNPGESKHEAGNVQDKLRERFGQLYVLLMEEVHAVLRETFYSDNGTIDTASEMADGKPTHSEISSILATLKLKAMENEVNADLDKSETLHLDRIAYIEQLIVATSTGTSLIDVAKEIWFEYACFCMRTGKLDKAGSSLAQCLRLTSHNLPATIALAALQLELGDFVQAEGLVKNSIQIALGTSGGDGSGWELMTLSHALLAYYYSQSGKDSTGNLVLYELIKAQQVLKRLGGEHYQQPNICAATVWIILAEYAHEHALRRLLKTSLQLANSSISPRDSIAGEQRVLRLVLDAWLSVSEGDVFNDLVVKTLRDAIEIDPTHALAWFTLGKLYLQRDNQASPSAIECFQRAMEQRRRLRVLDRMALYVHHGLALLHTSQFSVAEIVFLVSCDEFRNASSWLGVGIACLRMEKWNGAQLALAMANRLDSTNADVWGYLALLALTAHSCVTASDELDAKQFVSQALRYNLSNPVLLRELSNGFIAIDRLEHAERLLRRSLVCQDSSLTRKTLADVLSAQNCAEDALRQYAQSLNTVETVEERCDLLEKSAQLLVTLGRPEEAADYRAMANEFQT